ncbi:MAG: hypothetical protein ACYDCH_13630, partial [Gaiellaceae bacterium]
GRFWAETGIVAGAGLVLALPQIVGSWTSGLRLRLSPGTFLLGFVPVLVCAGWILAAGQPGNGWLGTTLSRWSGDAGLLGLVHALALWHGVLAFGLGFVLGLTLDGVPAAGDVDAVDRTAADEPLTAERRAAAAQPRTIVVGPAGTELEPADDREPVAHAASTTK